MKLRVFTLPFGFLLLLSGVGLTMALSRLEPSICATLTTIGMAAGPIAFVTPALAVRVDNPVCKRWIFRLAWVLGVIGAVSLGISETDHNHPMQTPAFGANGGAGPVSGARICC